MIDEDEHVEVFGDMTIIHTHGCCHEGCECFPKCQEVRQ